MGAQLLAAGGHTKTPLLARTLFTAPLSLLSLFAHPQALKCKGRRAKTNFGVDK